jgi:LPXTG-motif cell wall-anchored protein
MLHTDIPILSDFNFAMSMNISGTLPNSVQTGENATLAGFQTIGHVPSSLGTILAGLGATSVSGEYDSFDVNAAIGGVNLPPAQPPMQIAETSPQLGAFVLTAPASPTNLTFQAKNSGTLTVSAASTISGTLSFTMVAGSSNVPFDCKGAATPIASTTVKDKPKPPTTPPANHSSSQPAPPGQNAPQPVGLANGTPTTVTSTPSGSGTATGTSTSAHPQLAKTGFSQTEQLSVGGGLLILVGAGLMYLARRREVGDA